MIFDRVQPYRHISSAPRDRARQSGTTQYMPIERKDNRDATAGGARSAWPARSQLDHRSLQHTCMRSRQDTRRTYSRRRTCSPEPQRQPVETCSKCIRRATMDHGHRQRPHGDGKRASALSRRAAAHSSRGSRVMLITRRTTTGFPYPASPSPRLVAACHAAS